MSISTSSCPTRFLCPMMSNDCFSQDWDRRSLIQMESWLCLALSSATCCVYTAQRSYSQYLRFCFYFTACSRRRFFSAEMKRHGSIMDTLTGAYSQWQLSLSTQLASRHPELSLPMYSGKMAGPGLQFWKQHECALACPVCASGAIL